MHVCTALHGWHEQGQRPITRVSFTIAHCGMVPHYGEDMPGRRCLAYRQQDRPDVAAAAAHPYLVIRRARQGSAAASPAPAARPAPA